VEMLNSEELKIYENNMRYKFCPHCGGRLSLEETFSLSKPQCVVCNRIFYQNPAVGVAAIIIHDKKILLGRRNASYRDMWCIPCGYVEYYEDAREALIREIKEETNLDIKLGSVFDIHSNFHNPAQHTVGIWFLVEEYRGNIAPGDDIEALDFFSTVDIKEQSLVLAFPTDKRVLDDLVSKGLIL
jgi:ADP-ribose pyrophosphatase